jgi:myo-inositol 2-dehydrogenase/D-chiro-inositol 1-dehydrogenase
MNDHSHRNLSTQSSRRDFLKASSAAAVAAGTLSVARSAYAAGSDQIKIALIGCGGRGTGAANQALKTKANVRLIALADTFRNRVEVSYKALAAEHAKRMDVPEERRFVGLDAYEKAINCDADVVFLCTPPGFRPAQFESAVAAGKHVFMEKPLATDAPGIRKIIKANKVAKQKGLAVAVGFHLRHETKHREVVRRIHDGEIGKVHLLRAYFNMGQLWFRPRQAGDTEMRHQVRNWYHFTWVGGDHIVEQHVHDLDVCNWIQNAHPVEAQGMGGRQVRIGPKYGEIFDHHSVEFTYADGTKLISFCRQIPGCWDSFSQHAHGTKGSVDIEGHGLATLKIDGKPPQTWRREKDGRPEDGHQIEQDDLFAALAAGEIPNEADFGATSTLTAIMGRMATYSGQVVHWDEALKSDLELVPEQLTWDATPPAKPDENGIYPCAIPGVTKAI